MRVSLLSLPRGLLLSAGLLLSTAVVAQPAPSPARIMPAATQTDVPLAPLPSPDMPEGSKPSDYLHAAAAALTGHRFGEAEDALEKAETRLLDRSVPLFRTTDPSRNPASRQISDARQALAARDYAACLQLIQQAVASTTAEGL